MILPRFTAEQGRLLRRVTIVDDCWEVGGSTVSIGYAQAPWPGRPGRSTTASRVAWMLFVGPVPDELEVCHHCDNPPCIFLPHLWLGSPAENTADKVSKGRARGGSGAHWVNAKAQATHCPNGHEYTEENTKIRTRNGKPCRTCIRCQQLQSLKSKPRKRFTRYAR
jgi:hypothetical protein